MASNLTFNETRVLWDTAAYEANTTQPLLTYPPIPLSPRPSLCAIGMLTFRAMYTLYILDSTRHVTDIPQAGVLGNMLGFQFGMYQPQSYTPLPSTPPYPLPPRNWGFCWAVLMVANTCVICSDAKRVWKTGILWSVGLGFMVVVGGLRVLAW